MAYKSEFPQNFTREEIAELIFNVIPTGPDTNPKEVINGMLSEAARYIACATEDSETNEADIKVITDINEIPEKERNDVKMLVEDEISKTISSQSLTDEYYKHMNDVLSSVVFEIPESAPVIEEICNDNISEYHKLSSFDKKVKNQARQKLEKQALKYQNRHYKK